MTSDSQLQAAFWNVVVHALHALDVHLDGGVTPGRNAGTCTFLY